MQYCINILKILFCVILIMLLYLYTIWYVPYIIESSRCYNKFSYNLFLHLGAAFLPVMFCLMIQQDLHYRFLKIITKNSKSNFLTSLFSEEHAILFTLISFPVLFYRIKYGNSTFGSILLIYILWEIILLLCVFLYFIKRSLR
jgi:hypothetical protein